MGANHLGGGHQHHQYAPPTPPSQYDHNPHHHIPHHLIQHHVHASHQETEGSQTGSPQPLGTPVSWHSPAYSTPCPRGGGGPNADAPAGMSGGAPYEGWSPQPIQQTVMGPINSNSGPAGTPPPPSSVTPDYKMTPGGLDFPGGGGSPTMMGMSAQQPQDLSNGSGPPPAIPISSLPGLVGTTLPPQHASPDSGLAASSDGVSSSAGSPQHIHQLQHHGHHVQMGQQGGMQMQGIPPVQNNTLLQVGSTELRQMPPHQQAPPQQGRHPGQGGDQQQVQQQPRPQPVRSPYEWMKKPSYQSQPNPVLIVCSGKTRTKDKYRVVYSDRQRLELEKEFHYSRYITIRRKSELATALGLSDRQVKIWFQNRRAKERKHLKKREEVVSKDKMDPDGNSNGGHQQQPTRGDQTQVTIPDQMPPDLIPNANQMHIPPHTLHPQHLHHHHPHQQHHGGVDMNEPPPPQAQQQAPGMVLPLTSVTIGGVEL
ncbi:homeotic protein caudal-like [Hetaerina americana]|uniref:homeotic protein caudal-like n=1 Tax=Hetaerina americana TaxID=62018 RepID=UPI003A7F33CC